MPQMFCNAAEGRTAPSMAWLIKFAERVPAGYTAGDIVSNIIVPETRQHGCRYIDTVPVNQCGKPNFFISHRWGSPFSHLLTALKKDIGDKAGQMMTLAGNYQEAEPLMRETLELASEAMGSRSGAAASCVNNLAEVLRHLGKFAEAEPLQRQAVELSEELMGKNHPNTATYLGNLAQLEMALGKPAAAEPLLRRALDISIKSNGAEATDTAVLLNSLASLLLDLGRCVEMMRRALQSRMKILGEEHSDTVVSLNNLASLLFQQGKTAEAVPLYKQ
ncbi:hypothetical protein DUNSADRAFT_4644 [Dunaliella salina]|uniref:Kinesin light chain n=1 Tax=Dunaliella salina TaxID=3046 RepID=A0ABQ7GRL6_DUNSA|nr:hypothetical protein DUNSADRAFT_4644 [Dunaliella salina]|eukprot:KAF5837253.1 hypothetical protein DUNSADRAFT_4644 [Dunaliella salina]